MEGKPERGLMVHGRVRFFEHVNHAKAELAHGGGTVVFKPLDILVRSGLEAFTVGAGHQMDENVEIEYNRFFFVFHRHILVGMYGMGIL